MIKEVLLKKSQEIEYIYSVDFAGLYTGCPKKNQNYWNNVLLEFECPRLSWTQRCVKYWQGAYIKYGLIKKLKYLCIN